MNGLPRTIPLLLLLSAAAVVVRAEWPHVSPEATVLRNSNGMEAHIVPVGACVQRLIVPDHDGNLQDVILGFDNLTLYKNNTSVSGCILGRYGNRIVNHAFTLDGVTYVLQANSGNDSLHGGSNQYHRRDWNVEGTCRTGSHAWMMLTLHSQDGDQGFPGNLNATVIYTLTENNELVIDIRATTDKATPVNIMSHPYFNLKGHDSNITVDGHQLYINADYYMPNKAKTNTPTGEIETVAGTPYDFRANDDKMRTLGTTGGMGLNFHSLLFGVGKNALNVIRNFTGAEPAKLAATLYEPDTARGVDVLTTAPSFVTFTGYKSTFYGKGGFQYRANLFLALEAVMFPDGPNQPKFPSSILRPGEVYRNQVAWRFFTGPPKDRPKTLDINPTCQMAGECRDAKADQSDRTFYLAADLTCHPCPPQCSRCTNIDGVCKACNAGFTLKTKKSGKTFCAPVRKPSNRRMNHL